jgi:bifunctional non-homologous end joining protein LigD
MALETYRRKRDFKATPEPRGRKAGRKGRSFVVQKHAARRLHYDFRLEMDGLLRSWAVTRGPSLVTSEKRLAVHVEDHPLDYGGFEGTIPKGQYGGGNVIIWDRGSWEPLQDPAKGYSKGHLEFKLDGEKLGGRWHPVRMPKRTGEKRENWLLIKADDAFARSPSAPDILVERPESVKSGRVVEDVGEAESRTGRRKTAAKSTTTLPPTGRKETLPPFVEPALTKLHPKAPAGKAWLHEIKYDGYRIQARIEAGRVKLLTRSGLDWSKRFGKALTDAMRKIAAGTALIDGEIVVETDQGVTDFSALQADLSEGRTDRFAYYAFDLIHLDGRDQRRMPLEERKKRLRAILPPNTDALRFGEHFTESGELILQHVCRLSLEGIVSKKRDSPYVSGRNSGWVKSKCSDRQELVICGHVPSTIDRKSVGSLVLGVYKNGKLDHVGRVGTGFTVAVAQDLFKRLERLRVDESPYTGVKPDTTAARKVRYVTPDLVCEVDVRGWTADGKLRHASFRGLREDKPAAEVVREQAPANGAARSKPGFHLTHPERLLWPEDGVTKEGLADYYADVWRLMGPLVVGRPLALLRCPSGIGKQCFFQKHPWAGLSRAISTLQDPAKRGAGGALLTIDNLEGLIGLVQAGVLEVHPWGAPISTLEQPDYIVLDLDPGSGVVWADIVAAAREVRDRLSQAGLAAFVKTSGGKGLHVVSPLKPAADWATVRAFTKRLAEEMAADTPAKYVATITKSKRHGKILVDYLRNGRGATAVAAYSSRARPGAPVSMPVQWEELESISSAAYFTVATGPTRLASLESDPWTEFLRVARPLPASGKVRARKLPAARKK